jgi:hypothetical protein
LTGDIAPRLVQLHEAASIGEVAEVGIRRVARGRQVVKEFAQEQGSAQVIAPIPE